MTNDSGLTRLTVVRTSHPMLSPSERLLKEVRTSLGGQYEVFGELGRSDGGKVVYLARELASRRLVALQLLPAGTPGGVSDDYWIEVLRKLDASVPAVPGECPRCGNQLRGWVRYCSQCGADLAGNAPGQGAHPAGADDLLQAVKDSARGRYEILGQMDHAEGGGIVYFARDLNTGKLVALRLVKEYDTRRGTEQYSIGVTRVLTSLAESLDPRAQRAERDRGAPYAPTNVPPSATKKPAPAAEQLPSDRPLSTASAAPAASSYAPPPPPARPPVEPAPDPGALGSYRSVLRPAAIAGGVLLTALVVWLLARSSEPEGAVAATDSAIVDSAAGVVGNAADSGTVRIGAELPRGAVVTVDGQRTRGTTIRLTPGSHTFRISAPGFNTTIQTIEVGTGESIIWTPQLIRLPSGTGTGGRSPGDRPSGDASAR